MGIYTSTHGDTMNLTWLQVTLTGLGSQPWLTVVVVIQLGDEGEVAGDLPVVGDLELLLLQLTELHVLKFKLQSKEKTQTRLAARRGHMGRPPDSVAAARDGKCPHNVKLPAEDLPRSQAKMSLLIQLLSIR